MSSLTFQDIILALSRYWADQGCVVLQPYDTEVGAGTFHPATTLRSLGPDTWRTAYVQPSRRPTDGRYGENPNRLQHYYQYQVILKPSPDNVLDLYFDCLRAIGIEPAEHDMRLVEDDWESPTLGAWGLGWEVWLNGMEFTQFTYFQQVGGFECRPVPAEITYGLERLAMYIQGVDSVYDLVWSRGPRRPRVHLRRRLPAQRAAVLGVQLRDRRRRHAARAVHHLRGRMLAHARGRLRAAGLRLRAQVHPRVQPARRTGRDQRDRAPGLHPARAHPCQGVLCSISRTRDPPTEAAEEESPLSEGGERCDDVRDLVFEIGTEELPSSRGLLRRSSSCR